MDPVKKQFLKDCAKYISGELSEIKLNGSRKVVTLFASALKESRSLYVALNEKKSMRDVIPILESKNSATNQLRETTGFVWPF